MNQGVNYEKRSQAWKWPGNIRRLPEDLFPPHESKNDTKDIGCHLFGRAEIPDNPDLQKVCHMTHLT